VKQETKKKNRTIAGIPSEKDIKNFNDVGQLSMCAATYAAAIANPWSPDAQGACIPRHPARPSQKPMTKCTQQISFSNQYNLIYVLPTLANDLPNFVTFSSSTPFSTILLPVLH